MDTTCSSVKAALSAIFANELEVTTVQSGCIVTLPLKTADDRFIDVFIDRIPDSGFTYVHDGGKNTAELFAQGIHGTETQEQMLKGIARSHNAIYQQGRFQIACPNEEAVYAAVFSIAQCVSLAMVDVVTHGPKVEDEPLRARVQRALVQWQPSYVEIHKKLPIVGRSGREHFFDFVSMPVKRNASTVAIKVLPLSVGSSWQADRYGFMAYDIEKQDAAKWPRLAIISRAEEWSTKSLELVRALSRDVIMLEADHEERVERILPGKMTELTDAA